MRLTTRRSPTSWALMPVGAVIVVLLALLVWGGPPAGAAGWSVPDFDDVHPSYAYYDAIMALREHGSADGYPDNTFRPENPLWRAQFAKFIVTTLGMTDPLGIHVNETMVAPFIDLGPDDLTSLYPHEYVAVAASRLVTIGTSPAIFSPWTNVTRCQVVTMAVRATLVMFPTALLVPPPGYIGTLGIFDPVHGPAMAMAEYNGLLYNLGGAGNAPPVGWDPWADASRGETAQILSNLLGKS